MHAKALGNYVSNLAHTYFLCHIFFPNVVHIWTIVIVPDSVPQSCPSKGFDGLNWCPRCGVWQPLGLYEASACSANYLYIISKSLGNNWIDACSRSCTMQTSSHLTGISYLMWPDQICKYVPVLVSQPMHTLKKHHIVLATRIIGESRIISVKIIIPGELFVSSTNFCTLKEIDIFSCIDTSRKRCWI